MSIAIFTVCLVFGVVVAFWLNRIAANTARQTFVPLDPDGFQRRSIRIALERIGCTIDADSNDEVSGLIPVSGPYWGQRVSVRRDGNQLLVRSNFMGTQIFGGAKNQDNIDRFVSEWANRQNYVGEGGAIGAAHIEVVKTNARKLLIVGSVFALLGGAIVAFALLVPWRAGAAMSGRFRLIALAALPVLMGISNLWAGAKRLKESRRE